MIKGFPATNAGIDELINSEKGQNRNLGGALTRNNKWCNVSYKQLFLDFFNKILFSENAHDILQNQEKWRKC